MRSTYFVFFFLALFVGVKADEFSNGLMTGFVVKNIDNRFGSKKGIVRKYNDMTIDTSLIEFPINQSPQCMEVKIIEPLGKLTLGETISCTIIFSIISCPLAWVIINGSNSDREWFFGYFMGFMIETLLKLSSNDD